MTAILILLVAASCHGNQHGGECPVATKDLASGHEGEHSELKITNEIDQPVSIFWVDWDGDEDFVGTIDTGELDFFRSSYTNHVFRARVQNTLVAEKTISDETERGEARWTLFACGSLRPYEFAKTRSDELQALVDPDPLVCDGHSSQWSCLRLLNSSQVALRDPTKYGFTREEAMATAERKPGDTYDKGYVDHIPLIPKLSSGFLKMGFTKQMKDTLLSLYEKERPNAQHHEVISGDYTNNHKVEMTKIEIDEHDDVKRVIVQEMKAVLEWWTSRRLKHTSTFGIRIYHRDAMLVNHVDRADTHLASAVLQVAQAGVDEGWPLEVITEDGTTVEVYLQPGEMVLYEGARFLHGRPMRLQGEAFANVFTHFSPVSYSAVGSEWQDPLPSDFSGHPAHSNLNLPPARSELPVDHTEL